MSRHANDRGSATIWAAIGISVITTVLLVGLHLGSAVLARHRAEAAADLAALAAAAVAVEGVDAACRRAAQIVAAGGGTVTSCLLDGWDAVVEVDVPIPIGVPGLDRATGRARAGPVPEPDILGDPRSATISEHGPADSAASIARPARTAVLVGLADMR
ncbi:Rv3654c family TadE-like protein [Pseudonocardia zijingensis]|uniref:Rv3654c family TadE-like protein n=1 Tax=Pseudonocardia zijingensis TaxID=153376 RepID=UPI0036080F04